MVSHVAETCDNVRERTVQKMEKGRTFCYECRKDVAYTVRKRKESDRIRGREYEYVRECAVCDECGAELYVGELNDSNLKRLYDEYRRINDLISLNDVLEIRRMYKGKDIDRMLGWKAGTMARYCNGDVPSRERSDQLRRMHEELMRRYG